VLGAELKDLALPKDRAGRTVVHAAAVLRVIRSFRTRPVAEATEDRIPRVEIDVATGLVHLDGSPWLRPDDATSPADVARDARILIDYLASFATFFGNGVGRAAPAPGRRAGRHRSWVSGLRRAVRPLQRRQDAVHPHRRAASASSRIRPAEGPISAGWLSVSI
jgi:hypothetical protein